MSWSGFPWIYRKKRNGIRTSPPSGRRCPARAYARSASHAQSLAQIRSGSCYGLLVVLAAGCFGSPNPALADGAAAPDKGFCAHCDLLVGAGETTNFRRWTGGLVIPVTLELDDSRWEIGAFRLARRQLLDEPKYPVSTIAARPYWGFSLMHRWEILHRSRMRLYLGFGANYRTETDMLTATKWNFAGMIGVRFDLGEHALVEVSLRHWSNAWIRFPDRGQNFVMVSVGF